jgi:hypothetical protein
MAKKIAVVQFPGSNCEDESMFALRRAGIPCEQFLWNAPVEGLADYAGYFIVGGFSYEDRSRAGVIASLEPVLQRIAAEARKGKVVLGICNGAQVLVESGLVPGYTSQHLGMVLAPNRMERAGKIVGVGYYNDIATCKQGSTRGAMPSTVAWLPIQVSGFPLHMRRVASSLNPALRIKWKRRACWHSGTWMQPAN